MSFISKWNEVINNSKQQELGAFIEEYYGKECNVYEKLLTEVRQTIEGKAGELAEEFGLSEAEMGGFLDGINDSLEKELDLESIDADTEISMTINWKKLYKNMHRAKANWLYELQPWENIFSKEERAALLKEYRTENQAVSKKIGPNEPCPCGSGKKYKKCCME